MTRKTKILLTLVGLTVSVTFGFFFTPISDQGDGPDYIHYAMKLAGKDISGNYLYRSPLYPILLSLIIKISGIDTLPRTIIVLQYLMIFGSSILAFNIYRYFLTEWQSLIAVLIFYLSLSTVYYGYLILTETLTVFLFLLTVFLLLKWIKLKSDYLLFLLGVLISLAILARFNTLPFTVLYLVIILFILLIARPSVSPYLKVLKACKFLLPVIMVLNIYAFYNFKKNDFYGIFPTGGSLLISRNSILATIDGTEKVSKENEEIYHIFLLAAKEQKPKIVNEEEVSLLMFWKSVFNQQLYSGFQIYRSAEKSLCSYFGINPKLIEPTLSQKLESFYREIASLNRERIFMMRIYSLLNSLKSSSGITMAGKEVNVNILPVWSIIGYKFGIILISIFTLLASIIFIFNKILKDMSSIKVIFVVIIIYLNFYLINFFFVIGSDSNRYKFPGEPLMFGLFVYFFSDLIKSRVKKKVKG